MSNEMKSEDLENVVGGNDVVSPAISSDEIAPAEETYIKCVNCGYKLYLDREYWRESKCNYCGCPVSKSVEANHGGV